MARGVRRHYFGQQKPPGNAIPDHRQKDHHQARQLNPFIRRRLPTARAHRMLWKYPQSAMLAIHGDLASLPNWGHRPSSKKPTPGEKPSLLVRRAGPIKRTAIAPKSGCKTRPCGRCCGTNRNSEPLVRCEAVYRAGAPIALAIGVHRLNLVVEGRLRWKVVQCPGRRALCRGLKDRWRKRA
jgi:hypothetical protein